MYNSWCSETSPSRRNEHSACSFLHVTKEMIFLRTRYKCQDKFDSGTRGPTITLGMSKFFKAPVFRLTGFFLLKNNRPVKTVTINRFFRLTGYFFLRSKKGGVKGVSMFRTCEINSVMQCGTLNHYVSVSYTHLTLPTNREV